MRYRFQANSNDGGVKSGFLEALDEAEALRQLERRSLKMVRLEPDTGEAPVHVRTVSPPPAAAPSPPVARPAPVGPQLDKKKVGLGLLAVVLVVIGALRLGARMVGNKTYHLHVEGQVSLVAKEDLGADYWNRVKLELSLQSPAWKIDRSGAVQIKGSEGLYHPSEERAQVKFDIGEEGNYSLDIDVVLPQAPGKGVLFFEAPGFPVHKKTAAFAVADKATDFRCQIDPVVIKRLKKKEGLGGKVETLQANNSTAAPTVDPEAREPDE